MNARDGYDHAADHDECDAPPGSDPLIRREGGSLFFRFEGSWWLVSSAGQLPPEVRRAWLAEEIKRDRAGMG